MLVSISAPPGALILALFTAFSLSLPELLEYPLPLLGRGVIYDGGHVDLELPFS